MKRIIKAYKEDQKTGGFNTFAILIITKAVLLISLSIVNSIYQIF